VVTQVGSKTLALWSTDVFHTEEIRSQCRCPQNGRHIEMLLRKTSSATALGIMIIDLPRHAKALGT